MFSAKLEKGITADFSFDKEYNSGILVIEGSVKINGVKEAAENSFVYFARDGEDFTIEAESKSIVLILSGEPINEPIASYGPFVMSTEKEIKQAYKDYYDGKFGYLED